MPNLTTAHTKKRRGRKLLAEPGPTEEAQLPPAPEILALIFKYLKGSPRTLLTLRQACHTTKVLAERLILAYATEHCRPTFSVTFPSSETGFYKTVRVTKDNSTLDRIVIECTTATLVRDKIDIFWSTCDMLCRLESDLEKNQLQLQELAEKKRVGKVAELIIETTRVVNVLRENLSGCRKDGREGGGEEEQLVAGRGVVDIASVLKAAQTELNAHRKKYQNEPMWSGYGETFELRVDAIGSLIRTLMLTPDAATAKDLFGKLEGALEQIAATWMQYAEELKMEAATAAESHKDLEDRRNGCMVTLNELKGNQSLKELFALYARQSGVPDSVFKNTGKFRVAPRITIATGGKTIVQAPGTMIPKSIYPLSEDASLVKISLGGLHTGKTSRRGTIAGTVFGLGALRGDELELLSIRIHTNVVGLCFMKCL